MRLKVFCGLVSLCDFVFAKFVVSFRFCIFVMGGALTKKGGESRLRRSPLDVAREHLAMTRSTAAHVTQRVDDSRRRIFELRRGGASVGVLRREIVQLRPLEGQLRHLSGCIVKLEACVIGMETQKMNRDTMSVLRDLGKYGMMTEAELAQCGDVVDDLRDVAEQHDHLMHVMSEPVFSGSEDDVDVEAFFSEHFAEDSSGPDGADVLPAVPSTRVPTVESSDGVAPAAVAAAAARV